MCFFVILTGLIASAFGLYKFGLFSCPFKNKEPQGSKANDDLPKKENDAPEVAKVATSPLIKPRKNITKKATKKSPKKRNRKGLS